ncbi:MAG: hypothetical protein ACOX0H_02950 [Patescibacteria group bacterium]|jgi:hypothetical protein
MKNDFVYQLGGVREGVFLYAPIFMYIFLKMRADFQKNENDINEIVDKISGKPCNQWPQEYKEEFEKLFTPEKKWIDLQREFIYFLIFIFSGYTFNHIKKDDQERMQFTLDYLFEIFKDNKQPWFILPPDKNAYNKYHNSDNPLLIFHSSISQASGEKDALFILEFISLINGVSKFYIKPAVDKLFQ